MKQFASLILIVALAAALSGCASTNPTVPPTVGPNPAGLVLRVDLTQALPPPASWSRLPYAALYGNGELITPGPVIAIYPGPARPNLVMYTIGEAGVALIRNAARSAGLDAADHLIGPAEPGAVLLRFTYVDPSGIRHVASAVQSLITPSLEKPLTDLLARLTDPGALGPSPAPSSAYAFTRLAVFFAPVPDTGGTTDSFANGQPWPLSSAPAALGQALGASWRCATLSGADRDTFWTAAASANSLTAWSADGGGTWQVILRPLLPDEEDCTGLN